MLQRQPVTRRKVHDGGDLDRRLASVRPAHFHGSHTSVSLPEELATPSIRGLIDRPLFTGGVIGAAGFKHIRSAFTLPLPLGLFSLVKALQSPEVQEFVRGPYRGAILLVQYVIFHAEVLRIFHILGLTRHAAGCTLHSCVTSRRSVVVAPGSFLPVELPVAEKNDSFINPGLNL